MLNVAPKELRENIARANGYLRRGEVARALAAMSAALRQFTGIHLMRGPRAELDIQISEFLNSLIHHQAMQPLLDPSGSGKPKIIRYQQGKENILATVLDGLARILTSSAEEEIRRKQDSNARKASLKPAQSLFRKGSWPRAAPFSNAWPRNFPMTRAFGFRSAKYSKPTIAWWKPLKCTRNQSSTSPGKSRPIQAP